jgi:hypothetical protein
VANSTARVSGTQICTGRSPCARRRRRCARTLSREDRTLIADLRPPGMTPPHSVTCNPMQDERERKLCPLLPEAHPISRLRETSSLTPHRLPEEIARLRSPGNGWTVHRAAPEPTATGSNPASRAVEKARISAELPARDRHYCDTWQEEMAFP